MIFVVKWLLFLWPAAAVNIRIISYYRLDHSPRCSVVSSGSINSSLNLYFINTMSAKPHAARRWSNVEMELLRAMRHRLSSQIAEAGQFPEVVGDRALIKFLRGHQHDLEKASAKYAQFLEWRKEHGVDAIRRDIAEGGKRPNTFPFSHDFLIRTGPQIIISTGMRDTNGNPIAVETFNYSPRGIFEGRTVEDYTQYMMYCMEFKTMVLEQLSEIKERCFLEKYNYNPPVLQNGYGVILQCTIVRDLVAMTTEFMSNEAKTILKVSLDIAQNNYPEMLYKSHLVSTSWMFSTLWYFVKGLLDVRTAAKVTTSGTDFLKTLSDEVTPENLPTFIGGKYDFSKEPDIVFDLSEYGAMHLFRYDGTSPSCYLEYIKSKAQKSAAESVGTALKDITVETAAPIKRKSSGGTIVVGGILAASAESGIDRVRRASLSSGTVNAVILDLDGTLLDTEPLSTMAIQLVLGQYSIEGKIPKLTPELKQLTLGLPDSEWSALVISSLNLGAVLTTGDLLMQWESAMETLMSEVKPLPGALELIDRLYQEKISLAIATSSSSRLVALKKAAQPLIFDRIQILVCGDDPQLLKGKPNPDIFLLTAQRLGVAPSHCLVIEDSLAGVTAGKAAGMHICACVQELAGEETIASNNQKTEIQSKLSTSDAIVSNLTQFESIRHRWIFESSK